MSNSLNLFSFILLTLFWGGSFLGIGIAVSHFPPFFAALLRVFIALSFITFYLVVFEKKIERPKAWLQSMGTGLFQMGFPWVFLFWGEKYVSPALASILNATVPIFTALFAIWLTPADKNNWQKWAGVFLGFMGVAFIFAPEVSNGFSSQLLGLLAILLMAICYAIGLLWTRRIVGQIRNTSNLFYQSLSGTLFLGFFTLLFEKNDWKNITWTWDALASVSYLGLFSTAIAWLLFFRLVREMGSLQSAAVTYCVPFVAITLDIFYLGKWITWNQALGVIVILVGIFLIHSKSVVSTSLKTAENSVPTRM